MSRKARPDRDPECQRVLDAAGGHVVVGIAIGQTSGAVRRWLRVPAEYVPRLEKLTGIPAREIRPDMYLPLNPVAATDAERRKQIAALTQAGSDRHRAIRGTSRPIPKTNPPAVVSDQGAIGD